MTGHDPISRRLHNADARYSRSASTLPDRELASRVSQVRRTRAAVGAEPLVPASRAREPDRTPIDGMPGRI